MNPTPLKILRAASVALAISSCSSESTLDARDSALPPDTVLTDGKVFTADPAEPLAEAIVVREGRVVFVGSSSGEASFRVAWTESTRRRDGE